MDTIEIPLSELESLPGQIGMLIDRSRQLTAKLRDYVGKRQKGTEASKVE